MTKYQFKLILEGFVEGESSEQVAKKYFNPIKRNIGKSPKELKFTVYDIDIQPAPQEVTPNETSQNN